MDPVDANRLPTTGAVVDLVLAVTSFLAHYIMAAFRRMPNVSTNVPPRVRVLCPVAFVMLWAVLHVVATGEQPAFEACMVFVCIDVCGTMWSFHRYQLAAQFNEWKQSAEEQFNQRMKHAVEKKARRLSRYKSKVHALKEQVKYMKADSKSHLSIVKWYKNTANVLREQLVECQEDCTTLLNLERCTSKKWFRTRKQAKKLKLDLAAAKDAASTFARLRADADRTVNDLKFQVECLVEDNRAQAQEIFTVTKQLEKAHKKLRKLKGDNTELTIRVDLLEWHHEGAEAKAAEQQEELARAQDKCAALAQEVNALRDAADCEQQKRSAAANDTAVLTQQLDEARQELTAHREHRSKCQQHQQQLQNYVRAETQRLQLHLAKAHNECTAVASELSASAAESDRLGKLLHDAMQQLTAAVDENHVLKAQVAAAEAEGKRLAADGQEQQSQVQELGQEVFTLTTQLESAQREITLHKSACTKADAVCAELRRQNKRLVALQNSTVDVHSAECASLRAQLESANAALDDLSHLMCDQVGAVEDELDVAHAELRMLKDTRDALDRPTQRDHAAGTAKLAGRCAGSTAQYDLHDGGSCAGTPMATTARSKADSGCGSVPVSAPS